MRVNRHQRTQNGFATVEWLVAVVFSLLFLVMLTNIIAVQYGRGVLRAAADEGARAGARVSDDPKAACVTKGNSILDGIGTMAKNINLQCQIDGNQDIQAQVTATFPGWLPFVPSFDSKATAISVSEQANQPT